MSRSDEVTLVGAGLVGSLLSIFLAKRGMKVRIFERRPDMRRQSISAGRSINLALSTRGIHALEKVGIAREVLDHAIPMYGRMIHSPTGELAFQRYGMDDTQYINSVSRGELNKALMTQAEATGAVKIEFEQRATGVDLETGMLELNESEKVATSLLIGTDGSASAIRAEMTRQPGYECHESQLSYGYKELTIPAGPGGKFLIEKNALHIWPRGNFMLIALPNFDGSFTCTLFLPFEGTKSFAELTTPEAVREFFAREFPDALPLIPDLIETFFANPTGHMVTVKSAPWHYKDRVLLVGDAAHAIVPFYGQGMNCGFEDCAILDEMLSEGRDWAQILPEFSRTRKPDADAIADMAVENFVEMRDKVGDPRFLMAKAVEKILQANFPEEYVSRYSLVTFSRTPYRKALRAGAVQEEILSELCGSIQKPDQVDLAQASRLIRDKLRGI